MTGWIPTGGNPEFSRDTVPLIAGVVRGFRAWKVNPGGGLRGTFKEYEWTAGLNVAECLTEKQSPFPHQMAGLKCNCGFWAYYDTQRNPYYVTAAGWSPLGRVTHVLGLVEGWGRVTSGSRGFRCSKARIIALVEQPPPAWSHPGAVSEATLLSLMGLGKVNAIARAVLASLTGPPQGTETGVRIGRDVRDRYPGIPVFATVTEAIGRYPLTPLPTEDQQEGAA